MNCPHCDCEAEALIALTGGLLCHCPACHTLIMLRPSCERYVVLSGESAVNIGAVYGRAA